MKIYYSVYLISLISSNCLKEKEKKYKKITFFFYFPGKKLKLIIKKLKESK